MFTKEVSFWPSFVRILKKIIFLCRIENHVFFNSYQYYTFDLTFVRYIDTKTSFLSEIYFNHMFEISDGMYGQPYEILMRTFNLTNNI